MKLKGLIIILLTGSTLLIAQAGYVFRNETLGTQNIRSETAVLNYPCWLPDVRSVGMGQIRTAARGSEPGLVSNPAFLADSDRRIEVFGFQAGLPPATWDAAWYLEDHMDEFIEATSLNQILEGADLFFASGATPQERWDGLRQIQENLAFTVDLVNQVTGPSESPQKHGFSMMPSVSAQLGNWGFAIYGSGQAGFMVRQSATLDALAAVAIPEQPENLIEVIRPVLQIAGILGSGLLEDRKTFSEEVFPVAFYLSVMDITGSVGYGKTVWKNIDAGLNLKIINRRFSLNRIPVVEYDEIIDNAFSDLSESVTGITCDLGLHSVLPFGTNVGLSMMNIIPLAQLNDEISMDFIQHTLTYDLQNGQKQVSTEGDTLMVRMKRPVVLTLPFKLKLPFSMNIGLQHAITPKWSAGLEWLDLFENDTRYRSTAGRIRIGTEYRQPLWPGKLTICGRFGLGDEHGCGGLGLAFWDTAFLDGAYAWDPVLQVWTYYGQIRVIL
jgi:hypothetical protein